MRKRKAPRIALRRVAERQLSWSAPVGSGDGVREAGSQVDLARVEKALRSILTAIGEDPDRAGLKETPRRVARLYQKIFSGTGKDPSRELKLLRAGDQNGLVLVRDIVFHSMCEHHFLPFFGRVHVAYLPRADRITGLNSISRVTEILSSRLQLQERLTSQIADTLMKVLKPLGLLVVVEAEHLCMSMNESGQPGSAAVSSAARGVMLEPARRREALIMMNLQRPLQGGSEGSRGSRGNSQTRPAKHPAKSGTRH